MRRKYLHQSFGAISNEDLIDFESKAGGLPADYRQLLLTENGGVTIPKDNEYGSLLFYGIYNGPSDLRAAWRENIENYGESFLAIAENEDGDHVLLNLLDGSINISGLCVANNVYDYLDSVAEFSVYKGTVSDLIQNSDVEKIKSLIDSGELGVDDKASHGYNLLQYAVMLNKMEVINMLINYNASTSGCLHIMLSEGQPTLPLIRLLVDNGADIEECDEKGMRIIDIDSPWIKHIKRIKTNGRA